MSKRKFFRTPVFIGIKMRPPGNLLASRKRRRYIYLLDPFTQAESGGRKTAAMVVVPEKDKDGVNKGP